MIDSDLVAIAVRASTDKNCYPDRFFRLLSGECCLLLLWDMKTRPDCADFHHVREVKEWPKLRLCGVRAV